MMPLPTGIALAVTVGVFYALCALVWALAPGPFLGLHEQALSWHELQPHGSAPSIRWAGFLDGVARTEHLGFIGRDFFAWLLNRKTR